MKIKKLIASLVTMLAVLSTTVFAAGNQAILDPITYTANSGSVKVVVSSNGITNLDQYSLFKIKYDTSVFTYDADNSTTEQAECLLVGKSGYVQWNVSTGDTVIDSSKSLCELTFTVNAGKEANVVGSTFKLYGALLEYYEGGVEYEAADQTITVTAAGGNKTTAALENGKVEFTYAADADKSGVFEGKEIFLNKLATPIQLGAIDADTVVEITYTETGAAPVVKTYGSTLYELLGIDGEGYVATNTVTFGVVYDPALTGTFSFELK